MGFLDSIKSVFAGKPEESEANYSPGSQADEPGPTFAPEPPETESSLAASGVGPADEDDDDWEDDLDDDDLDDDDLDDDDLDDDDLDDDDLDDDDLDDDDLDDDLDWDDDSDEDDLDDDKDWT